MIFQVLLGLALLPFTLSPLRPHLCRSVSSVAGLYPCTWRITSPFFYPVRNQDSPASLGALLLAAQGLLDWPCLTVEAADVGKVCSGEKPALLSPCMSIFCLSHLGKRQWRVQVLLHRPPAQLNPLCTTRAGRVRGEGRSQVPSACLGVRVLL